MRWNEYKAGAVLSVRTPAWALVYATVDAPIEESLAGLTRRMRDVPVFGATSFRGVFCPAGFARGVHVLTSDAADGIAAEPRLVSTPPSNARPRAREAAQQIVDALGARPDVLLLHATPGFEEAILQGIAEAFDGAPPAVYGGSAADDDLRGEWKIFCGVQVVTEGFLLVGFRTAKRPHGAFVSGYNLAGRKGKITRARGRTVYEIDGEPAAVVYNRWVGGAIDAQLRDGGVVLAPTTLRPLGRLIDQQRGVPRYLLSHPHQVLERGALSFFTEMANGDEVALMMATESSLLSRTEQVVQRALGSPEGRPALRGGILIYCGGCVGALGPAVGDVSGIYAKSVGGAPFLGAATFGEEGCYSNARNENRHGNLMCSTILFE